MVAKFASILLAILLITLVIEKTHQLPVTTNQLSGQCGTQSLALKNRRGKRIVGGGLAFEGKWPWIAALLVNGSQYCAGSIIDNKWIVTTSHCFHDKYSSTDARHWKAKVGKFNIQINERSEQTRAIKRIIHHPNYTSMWDTHHVDVPDDYDIALLELDTPMTYSEHVQPICLQRNGVSFTAGELCTVAGWGHTASKGQVQDKLHDVEVELVSRAKCNSPSSYNGTVHERAICAGYEKGGRDACQYDSGGPLVCRKGSHWYLTGQVSWGDDCAKPHKYGVYTNMKLLVPWVLETIATK